MGDEKLKFEIKMEEGNRPTLTSFLKIIGGFMKLLDVSEKSLTGRKRATQRWIITDIGVEAGKYFVEIQGEPGKR